MFKYIQKYFKRNTIIINNKIVRIWGIHHSDMKNTKIKN